ncbi:hypothetical protein AB990_12225 [Alkalihalobacillus pseudalcaliphilus]|nr:hypothetical protein AB990_12225 [Alkalihalobacillus pseudalcaliphilus]
MERNYVPIYHRDDEIWLEDDSIKPVKLLRLVRKDSDWTNRFRENASAAAQNLDFIRKQRRIKELQVENIYFCLRPPVDDWSKLEHPIAVGKSTMVRNHFVFLENSEGQLELSEKLEQMQMWKQPLHVDKSLEPIQLDAKMVAYKYEVRLLAQKIAKAEKDSFSYGKPIFTYIILAINILAFLLIEYYGESESLLTLIEVGAKYTPLLLDGEWWRLVTTMFIHIGFLHLMMNSLALYFLGTLVERMYGSLRFFGIYVVAGITGSIVSMWTNLSIGAGASGAIFGLFGALLYFGLKNKRLFLRTMGMNVFVVLAINLVFGFVAPFVDNGAHIGGLIGGFVAAAASQLPKEKRSMKQLVSVAIILLAFVAHFLFIEAYLDRSELDLLETQIAYLYIEEEDYEKAFPHLERPYLNGSELGEVYFYLGYLKANDEKYEEARELFEQAVERNPQLHPAYFNLSLLAEQRGEIELAIRYVKQAIDLEAEPSYQERLEYLEN